MAFTFFFMLAMVFFITKFSFLDTSESAANIFVNYLYVADSSDLALTVLDLSLFSFNTTSSAACSSSLAALASLTALLNV